MGTSTLVFQTEFELGHELIPEAIRNAVSALTTTEDIQRVEITIVERERGHCIRIEGRKVEGGE